MEDNRSKREGLTMTMRSDRKQQFEAGALMRTLALVGGMTEQSDNPKVPTGVDLEIESPCKVVLEKDSQKQFSSSAR